MRDERKKNLVLPRTIQGRDAMKEANIRPNTKTLDKQQTGPGREAVPGSNVEASATETR